MNVKWFSPKEKLGVASLYGNSITLNTVAGIPFEYAYRVQVGIDEAGNIIIQSLSKERVDRGDLDEYCLLPLQVKQSYTRINSTQLMNSIAEATHLQLGKTPLKFETQWNEVENYLIIRLDKEVK